MRFPSRQAIHDVVQILSEWNVQQFFHNYYNQNYTRFDTWCIEVSKETILKVSHGCTKIVVKFGDDDWVIKIPYKTAVNYCKLEAENYAYAHRAKLTKYFAPCYFYGVIDEIPVYLQRRVEKDDYAISSDCYQFAYNNLPREDEENDDDYADRISDYIENDMDDYEVTSAIIGENKKLLDFIWNQDINDLHKGNFGYLNGAPVIFDYSGF